MWMVFKMALYFFLGARAEKAMVTASHIYAYKWIFQAEFCFFDNECAWFFMTE
jgi:hypothetical protein